MVNTNNFPRDISNEVMDELIKKINSNEALNLDNILKDKRQKLRELRDAVDNVFFPIKPRPIIKPLYNKKEDRGISVPNNTIDLI